MEKQKLPLPSDLVLLGFTLDIDKVYEKIFIGHRLRLQLSEKHIRIKMSSCSCTLVQAQAYSLEDLKSLLKGLQIEI